MRAAMVRTFERTPIAPGMVVSEKAGVRFEAQSQWRFLILVAFFTGGFGAGLYIASWALDFRLGMVLGLFMVAVIKGGAHVAYLGRPERFWRAIKRPRTSWISRGIISMGVFVIAGSLYVMTTVPALGWLAVAGAVVVMAYTGYLMAFSPSIPFWNNALLPVLFLIFRLKAEPRWRFRCTPRLPAHQLRSWKRWRLPCSLSSRSSFSRTCTGRITPRFPRVKR